MVETLDNRAEYKYIHNGREGISTAFEINEKAELRLFTPRALGTVELVLEIYDESLSRMVDQIRAEWRDIKGKYDCYSVSINCAIGSGLYFMRPRIDALGCRLYGHKWAGGIYFDYDPALRDMLQMTLCDFKYTEPKRIRGGVIYHVFVDRFNRGGRITVPDGARLIRGNWSMIPEYPEYPGAPLYNNTFWGGTLWGIISKLDYIKSLGTTAIYLSPVFKAFSNHKYDTGDYMTVDEIFGGEAALRALINAAKIRNIEIILDGVFNHTGADSIYFNKFGRYQGSGAYQSRKSPYYDWYDFKSFPNKYASWWGIEILPRINPDNPSCGEYFVGEEGVIAKYRDMGIYGFRLDVADELSDSFISRIKARLNTDGEDRILYGEVWEDASNKTSYSKRRSYYQGEELDGVMNYPVRTGIIDYVMQRGCDSLRYALCEVSANAPERILHNQMNLLGTHDTERILTVLGGDEAGGRSNHDLARLRMSPERRLQAVNRLINAYTILATIPGIPAVFYGDEAGLEGYKDPFNRMPYPWGHEEKRLVEHYRTVGNIRRQNSIYECGDFRLITLDPQLLVFARYEGDEAMVTVFNNSSEDISLEFSSDSQAMIRSNRSTRHILSALTSEIYKIKKDCYFEIN